jgi:hypothetical protein
LLHRKSSGRGELDRRDEPYARSPEVLVSDTPRLSTERPDWACLLHLKPSEGRSWTRADDGYRTCSKCLDQLRATLQDIPRGYLKLNARPGATGEGGGRGVPGFRSSPAANLNIVVMRDHRSQPFEVSSRSATSGTDPTAEPTRNRHTPSHRSPAPCPGSQPGSRTCATSSRRPGMCRRWRGG